MTCIACRSLLLAAAGAVALLANCARGQDPAAEVTTNAQVQQPSASSAHEGGAQHPASGEGAGHEQHGGEAHGHAVHVGVDGVSTAAEELKSDLAIYTFVVFLLMVLVLWKFAWGPISAGLEKREQRIAEQIAAAHKANDDAKKMLAEYERKIAGTADEVRAIIDEARRDAEHTQQEILAKARADAQVERERGIREIETATNQALKQLAEMSANLAVDLAGKILRAQINPADHTKLIEESTAKFLQGSPSKN